MPQGGIGDEPAGQWGSNQQASFQWPVRTLLATGEWKLLKANA
jgi:hypothetical protein